MRVCVCVLLKCGFRTWWRRWCLLVVALRFAKRRKSIRVNGHREQQRERDPETESAAAYH